MRDYKKIEGLIAAVFTPLKEGGEVNPGIIPAYAEDLKLKGVGGVFVSGSSGEGLLLTTEERKLITEAWSPYASKEFKFVVHVGSTSIMQSVELTKHAQENGAWAISAMGPAFLQPQTAGDLVSYCKEVAAATPNLPFYYYHIPTRSGVDISMPEFLRQGGKVIPNLAGVKFTHVDFTEMQQCIAIEGGRFDIVNGFDETLVCGLSVGVKGAIGTSFNYLPRLYTRIMDAFNRGDTGKASKLQQMSVAIGSIIAKYRGVVVAGKAMEKMVGIDCGPCRLPLKGLTPKEYKNMEKELDCAGFFDLINSNK